MASCEGRVIDGDIASIRRQLAAAYRLSALFGWDDHVATHFSALLPDGTFLLNRFGLMFDEITASNLMRVSMNGDVVDPPGTPMNLAGFNIHSAMLSAREDINCAIHLHSRDGMVVSATKDGLLPLNQTALSIRHEIAYHPFEGVVSAADERERLQADLGEKHILILRNHGSLTVGRSIAMAFYRTFMLEQACTAQVRTLSLNVDLELPSARAQASMEASTFQERFAEDYFWPAMMRKAERDCPGFDL